MKIHHFLATVIENCLISPDTYRLTLSLPHLDSFRALPGQFIMIRSAAGCDPLLRRPFSIHSLGDWGVEGPGRLTILFRVVGQGTRLMAEWRPDQAVDMVGPLGTGYSIPESLKTAVLVAGGLGAASLFGLAESILLKRKPPEVWVFIGGRSQRDILMNSKLEAMGARLEITTEDGTIGTKGMVTDLLEKKGPLLPDPRDTLVYACGPPSMLARVAFLSERLTISCQVSLEARMACGVGSCLSCVVKTKNRGYQRVCKEGPVFSAAEIAWEGIERLL